MQFQIQDLVEETPVDSMYRAVGEDGRSLLLTRTRLEPELREALMESGVFERALAKLRSLEHEYLRVVVDGGMESDSGPWVTSHWLDAKPLCECTIADKDLRNLAKQFQDLIAYLGVFAGAIDFDDKHILTMRAEDGRLACLFGIDEFHWFKDFAEGRVPGVNRCVEREVRKVIENLAIKQLRPSKVDRKRDSIPFVDERSPALTSYPDYREPMMGRVMFWGTLIVGLLVIVWFTAM